MSPPTPTPPPARALDAKLQEYAYRALVRPRTGIVYNATVPGNLTGVSVSALRLRSGSLRRKGLSQYFHFGLPTGVIAQPRVERMVAGRRWLAAAGCGSEGGGAACGGHARR